MRRWRYRRRKLDPSVSDSVQTFGRRQAIQKYDEIEVMAKKARSDQRPESYQVDPDSISVVRSMSSGGNKWNEVRERLLPLVSASMCVIQEQRKITRVTLAHFNLQAK